MVDMTKTIAPKSDQINADDLIGITKTITITRVTGNDNADQPVNVFFDGDDGKPFRPCKSMRRVMVHCWGPDATKYVGKSMTLYCDPDVTFGGMKVGGIRISHMSHIDVPQTMALTASKAKRKPYRVQPLATSSEPDVDYTDDARAAASKGSEAFRDWWKANKQAHKSANSIMDELKRIAAEADAKAQPDIDAEEDEDIPL